MAIPENKEKQIPKVLPQEIVGAKDVARNEVSPDSIEKVYGIPLNDAYTLAAFLLTSMNITVNEGALSGESLALDEKAHEAIKKSCVILNHALSRAMNMVLPEHGVNSNMLPFPSYALEGTMVEDRRASCFFLSEKGVLCFKGEGRDANRALPMQKILEVIKLKEDPNAHLSHKQVEDELRATLLRMDIHINAAKASNDSKAKDGWVGAESNSNDERKGRAR